MRVTYTLFGKEVHHPVLKIFVAVLGMVGAIIGIIGIIVLSVIIIATLPVSIPCHFVLRATGRYGFFYRKDGVWCVKFTKESFERRW